MKDNERISITGIMAANPDAPSDELRVEFYPDGKVKKVGYSVKAGLCEGRVYYPSGNLQYEGSFSKRVNSPAAIITDRLIPPRENSILNRENWSLKAKQK